MILLALKSLFFVTAIIGYSTGVWRLIGNYFQQEFKTYLDEEVKKNKYLLVDPVVENSPAAAAGSSTVEIVTESEVRQAGKSVTANRLLDEMIVNFGRLFATSNEAEFARKRTSETAAKEIITSTSRNVRKETVPDLDPGGAAAAGGSIIESDKFPRTSSSEVDNKSDEDDVASDDDGDGEEKWIKYWENRERGIAAGADGDRGEGHCEAKLDACGP
ncbi:uncharacterized protein LOC135711476 isoform X2 [Ochlerotatus camptorhynchus]|uniref:uncharacterized protein LOC135711476 isoform X2 n=1 Tax=Ochlerotatus camptorhynchus TaxID=644619 RepID=UPI0031D40F0C